MTFSITTLSIMTFSMKTLIRKGLFATLSMMTFSIIDTQHKWNSGYEQHTEYHFAECRFLFIFMLSVVSLCLVSLRWMSLCWVSLCWVSRRGALSLWKHYSTSIICTQWALQLSVFSVNTKINSQSVKISFQRNVPIFQSVHF